MGMARVGTATPEFSLQATDVGMPPQGMSRIHLVRKHRLKGSIVKVQVVDMGDDPRKDIILVDRREVPFESGNFYRMRYPAAVLEAATYDGIVLKNDRSKPSAGFILGYSKIRSSSQVQQGRFHRMLCGEEHGWLDTATYYGVPKENPSRTDAGATESGYFIDLTASKLKISNHHLVARDLGSGESVTWDRPPGVVRLTTVVKGVQEFALPFDVKAGRVYGVDYTYAKGRFEIYDITPP